jgi:hypothetical protein
VRGFINPDQQIGMQTAEVVPAKTRLADKRQTCGRADLSLLLERLAEKQT